MAKKIKLAAVAAMFLLMLITITVYTSCKKVSNEQATIVPEYVKNDSLKQNVSIIKSGDATLTSDSTKLSQGLYDFQFNGTPINYKVGDVIVGQANNGFLRKVTNSTVSGNNVTLQTQQATLEDLYKDANINFQLNLSKKKSANILNADLQSTKINYMAEGVSLQNDGLSYDFSNTTIYQQGPLTFKITDGNVTYNPNYVINVNISSSTINKISFYADNADLNINCDVNLNASQNVQLVNYTKKLADVDKDFLIWVSAIPIIVVINTKLNAKLTTDVKAGLNVSTGFTNNYKITLGAIYENSSWSGKYNLTSTFTGKPVAMSGTVQFTQNLSITPEVSVKLYGVAGPYFTPEMYAQFDAQIASPSLDWDALLKVGINAIVGADITIFGKTLVNYSKTYNAEKELWKAPSQMAKISGDNQTGTANKSLTQPLKIKVTDNLNNPIKNAIVYFNVTQGGGSVNNTSILTDANGSAETIWTIGTGSTQELKAKVKKADGTDISGSPLTFTTSANDTIAWLTNGSTKTWSLYSFNGAILPLPDWTYEYYTFNIDGTFSRTGQDNKGPDGSMEVYSENGIWSFKNGKIIMDTVEIPIEISPTVLILDGGTYKPKQQ